MEKICGIYKITSPIGKIYIGQSPNIKRRIREHQTLKNDRQPKVYESLIEHGVENHTFEIVEECLREDLCEKEIFWIKHFKSFGTPHGLNMTAGGKGSTGFRHSKKSKERFREIANNRPPFSEEHVEKITKTLQERYANRPHHTKGCTQTPDHIAKRVAKNTGKKRNQKAKDLTRDKLCKIVLNTETGIFYMGTKDAASSMGINPRTLKGRLNGQLKNNTPFVYT